MRKAIAIDFDGCLCEWAWPEIGAPNMEVISAAIKEKENGPRLSCGPAGWVSGWARPWRGAKDWG